MRPPLTRPVPVLLMVRELGIGGSERQTVNTALSLDRSRFEPHVACFREGFLAAELRAAGIPVLRLPVTSFRSWSAIRGARMMGDYLRRHAIQLVHTFDTPLNVFGVPVARFYRTPVVLSSQRAHRDLSESLLPFLRITDRMVHGIVVNSRYVQQHLIEEGVAKERIHLCYNGLDASAFPAAPRIAGPLTIGVVCALRPEKGLPTLVDAFARVFAQHPALRLKLIGSGNMQHALEQQAAQQGISQATTFLPTTSDVAAHLRTIDIFVLPSLSEALSNSLMEAMAAGCCPVASVAGGNPELITPERTGLLFPPGDATALSAALTALVENPALRDHLASNAAIFIRDNFSLQACGRTMGSIYDRFLGRF